MSQEALQGPAPLEYRDIRGLSGWLGRTDFEIFRILLAAQASERVEGALAEIGVHHGKSAIALTRFAAGAKLYAIDLFGDQSKNLDRSGRGDRAAFEQNLARFGIDASRVVVDARASDAVTASDVLGTVGEVRFFHIDGGHHYDAVVNDLELAAATLSEGGIIAIDDLYRAEWPEVSAAVFDSGVLERHRLVCFAIGFNKGYYCHRAYAERYRARLRDSKALELFLQKVTILRGVEVPVYQTFPVPEWGARPVASWLAATFWPRLFMAVKRRRRRHSPRRGSQ